jgi:hypothetical protein
MRTVRNKQETTAQASKKNEPLLDDTAVKGLKSVLILSVIETKRLREPINV